MANNSHSLKRDKRKLEPISIEELALDSTMTGFSALFRIPVSSEQSSNRHMIDAGYRPLDISNNNRPPETGPPETGPPETGPPETGPLPRKLQIREAKLVQEGHTYGEQTVYDALWKHATVLNENIRVITIGFLRMAHLAGLAESNCKVAVAGLLDKLALEQLPDRTLAQGRTYRIHGWAAVLARRRAAGLTHVIKSRGVVFVDPKTGSPLTTAKTVPRKSRQTAESAADLPGDLNLQQTVADLASRLRRDFHPAFDDGAAGRLWRECQSSVPDCTIDEIMHFVGLKAKNLREGSIRNPIGLLLMNIPEYFTGNGVRDFRAQKGREENQHREMKERQQKYWKEIADDLSVPADERELAARFLK